MTKLKIANFLGLRKYTELLNLVTSLGKLGLGYFEQLIILLIMFP